MELASLSDQELVDRIAAGTGVAAALVDEYYRRCIPVYLDFLGTHWHTGEIGDMRTLMPLAKGFTVTPAALAELERDIRACDSPLLALTLAGLGHLGRALAAGAFTIGRFRARKPARDRVQGPGL